jgi:hypothetical protein
MSAQEVTLKVNYKKGDSYLLKMEMKQSLELMGGMNMKSDMVADITEVTEEKITSETRIKRVIVDVLQGAQSFKYDSETKDEDLDMVGVEMKKQFEPMMNAVITQVSDRYGQILEAKVEPKVPGMDNFGQQSEYPKEPVKVGSTWTSEVADDTSGTITMNYKVDKITDTTLFASITGTASSLPGSTISGSLEVDIASGNPNIVVVKINADVEGSKMSIETAITSTKIN